MIDAAINERVVDFLTALFVRPGSVYQHDDPMLHWPRLMFEWRSGQWSLVLDTEHELVGWASWYRCDAETLAGFRRGDDDDWIRQEHYPVLNAGPHCYIATTIVAPTAPRATYRHLIDNVGSLNREAASLAANVAKRDGRERFAQRWNDGTDYWWRARQNDWRKAH